MRTKLSSCPIYSADFRLLEEFTSKPCLCVVNHELQRYDACSENRDAYDETEFRYIGQGYIRMAQGKVVNMPRKLHFWVRRNSWLRSMWW